ncbi:unnamed protein product [Lactuca saligna]|uniref:Receptor-like serine/threonine-protein kinase n=1 Tax=Lactuca saligna TaxID=75948 RepID=A0AA35UVR2_LACSI|nr:unnamed protein product [Lactuca saligna]
MAATIATFLLLFLFLSTSYSATTYTGSISSSSNFTASNFHYVDQNGDFLRSVNRTYTAAMFNSQPKSPSFYLLIYHSDSRNVVWVANRNKPISNSGQLLLSFTGITIYDDSGIPVWSTPTFNSTVASLQLLDSGNLLLIDRFNKTLWQSFDYPTDTIVSGQRFPVGGSLIASNDDADFSEGGYTFTVTTSDGLLRWQNLTYYRLMMDSKSVINSNQPISYLMVNGSGFYLFGGQGSEVVVQVLITTAAVNSDDRILKLTNAGYLNVMRYTNRKWVTDFTTPEESCRAPFSCGKLGLCSPSGCSCPPGFRGDRNANPGCSPSDNSILLPESCGGNGTRLRSNSSEKYVYIPLGDGMKYYPIDFTNPTRKGVNLSTCENLCSSNCSCLAIFHGNPSGSCYLLQNHLGSFISSSTNGNDDTLGFIKAISLSQNHTSNSSSDFPVVALILLPGSGVLLISIFAIWMRIRSRNNAKNSHSKKLNDNLGSEDLELFSIAGLPIRFDHEDLVEATKDFSTQIGSGGFGTVYKGVLRDKTVVAVKKITSLGAQGKKEFGTEIAIIGNIHHGRKNCVQAPSHSSGNPTSSTDGQSSGSTGSRNHSQARGRARARAFYFPLHALEMHEEGRYLDLVDPRLAGRVTRDEAEKLVKVALCCLHEDPLVRLTMANVVGMLEGVLPVAEPRLDSLNFLRFYGQRFTEPSMVGTGEEVEVGGGFMVTTNYSSSPSMSLNSFSYMSSQQVSGPR